MEDEKTSLNYWSQNDCIQLQTPDVLQELLFAGEDDVDKQT
jgi:hypothetical protein